MFDETRSSSSREEDVLPSQDCTLMALNETLISVGESPIQKRKAIRNRHYIEAKIIRKVDRVVKKALKCGASREDELLQHDDACERIQQLKDKFATITVHSQKMKILAVLPRRWPSQRLKVSFQ